MSKLAAEHERCTCTYPGCSRKGICCECVRHHRESGQISGCFFQKEAERAYDRSVESFRKNAHVIISI